MKNIKLSILALLLVFPLFLANVFAEDYTRWDLPEGAVARLGKGSVGNLMFSHDGNRLIVQSSIGLWIYDTHTGVELDFIALGPSTFIGVSPDAQTYVSLDADDIVRVRDLTTNSVKATLKADAEDIRRVVFWADRSTFSADSKMFAYGVGEEIQLWSLTTGEQRATFTGHTKSVDAIAFSPDGTTLASRSYDNTLRLWDVATATHKTTLSEYARGYDRLLFSQDSSKLIAVDGNTINLWDIETRKQQKFRTGSNIYRIALSPDGNTIAGGRGDLHLWNAADGTHIAELSGHPWGVSGIAFSPDGTTLASGGGSGLFLWDVKSRTRKLSISGHTIGVAAIAFSPDGKTLATGGREEIHLWAPATAEYKTGIYLRDWSFNRSLAFSPDGNTLACYSYSVVFLWDVSRGTYIAALEGYGGDRLTESWGFSEVVFSPDGQFLAGASDTSTAVHIWRLGRTQVAAFTGHTAGVTSIDLSQDSRILVSGSHDRTVRLWDFASGNQIGLFTGHTDRVYDVAFNPDASIVASGSKDNTIILWNVATDESRVIHTGYTDGINSLDFSIDGRTLVSSGAGYDDTSLRFWDVATGDLKLTRTGHRYSVRNIVFSPDGKTLASGSSDGTVLLWDATTFSDGPVAPVQHAEDVNRDGVVDLQDLIFVASQLGQSEQESDADVNADGIVNIEDILLVAAALENGSSAPSSRSHPIDLLTAAEVRDWLSQARQVSSNTPTLQKGIARLEQLLTVLIPEKTVLLPNYPNPFNPETWIPYQLANSAEVTLRIYSATGHLVRVLKLGHQPAGIYQHQSRAAYWDGKNERGEPVASGVYFYTLSADDVTATRRMVIRK